MDDWVGRMKEIGYRSETELEYAQDLDKCNGVVDLLRTLNEYGDLTKDAREAAYKIMDADWDSFKQGLKNERKGIFAGEEWFQKYQSILMPEKMVHISMVAERFKVPFGCAYIRMKEEKML